MAIKRKRPSTAPSKRVKKVNGKKKRPEGRPSKYKDSYPEDILQHFLAAKDTINIPFISEWCRDHNINSDTMYEWIKVHPKFSEAYTKCQAIRKEMVLKNGVNGKFNAAFSIFYAKCNLGMNPVEKQEVAVTGLSSMLTESRKRTKGK